MHELLKLQNFDAFVALHSALNHVSVFRLNKSKSVSSINFYLNNNNALIIKACLVSVIGTN